MESFSVDEISNCTNCIITFVLNGASTKLPLKEKDMVNNINMKGKIVAMALTHARAALKETYGLLLVDVPNCRSGKAFICYSEEPGKSPLLYDEAQQRHLTLLFVILSYLFMRGSDNPNHTKTSEDELVLFLNNLRIRFDETHPYFGSNLKKLITETFVKQLYLRREKVVSELDVETKFYYYWGFRASVEFDKKMLLEATAKKMQEALSNILKIQNWSVSRNKAPPKLKFFREEKLLILFYFIAKFCSWQYIFYLN